MSKYRRAAKIDANQPDIVDKLRKAGYSVEVNHDDILVGFQGRTFWYEIKEPEKALSKKTGEILESVKKDSQKRLEKEWKGHYRIVSSLEDILLDMELEIDDPL
jgi:hypothetical protein